MRMMLATLLGVLEVDLASDQVTREQREELLLGSQVFLDVRPLDGHIREPETSLGIFGTMNTKPDLLNTTKYRGSENEHAKKRQ